MEQSNISKYFFFLFTFSLVFVILFYKVIGFQFTDELCVLVLVLLFLYQIFSTPNWVFNKAFLFTLFLFLFYTCYSIWIGSNTKAGIFNDLIVQMKPYLSFFCAYQLRPTFTKMQKKILKEVAVLFWLIWLLPIGLVSLVNERIFEALFEHPAYYGIAVTIVALCYYFCSESNKRTRIFFLLLLSIGLFCGKSKFYGFYAMTCFIVLLFPNIKQFQLNFKNVTLILCMITAIVVVAWPKINFYFVNALSNNPDMDKDMIARLVLYGTFPLVLQDYFPFGSGLASFGTHSSGEYYSPLYEKYGIDNVWGLSKSYHGFMSDTFYPSLAQFGVIGVILFLLFWMYILKKAFIYLRKGEDVPSQHFTLVMLIIGFIIIENTTGSTFIAQGGAVSMMLLGLILSEMQYYSNKSCLQKRQKE
ncbi:O-antigen ligase domain-containing protein [Parabacteroides sp. OttesenSCG-928-J18]|nr:O-antigen ligase domain-containing protein [Parabacteroides sp. OttesenSCG-928-J18]